jgi:hypothetical protein
MSNYHLRDTELSLKAKGLLSLMLSLPDDWDYTLFGLTVICKDGMSSIRAAIAELEEAGYLSRHRIRNEKGQLADTEYTILEQPEKGISKPSQPICDFPILDNPTLEKPMQGKPILENRTQLSIDISNTQKQNTELSSTHPSINPPVRAREQDRAIDRIDTDAIEVYREVVQENISYGVLCERHGAERVDEAVELILETLAAQRPYIRIAGDDFPAAAVKSRLLKVDAAHVEYVFGCLDENTTKIRNIKSYLLTALYNAPATMDSYYRAEVNHDLYGGGA